MNEWRRNWPLGESPGIGSISLGERGFNRGTNVQGFYRGRSEEHLSGLQPCGISKGRTSNGCIPDSLRGMRQISLQQHR
jgi:hypothetical protein